MKGTNAWTFKEVTTFLTQNHFKHIHTEGSHYLYYGLVDGEERLVEVQYHSGSYIKQGTLEKSIINKSGIPSKFWKEYTKLPPNKRKKYIYIKAEIPKI
ncbi:MAG TPA: hypothetical protein VII94_02295 [Candidatus Saccharimonadales bacterium]